MTSNKTYSQLFPFHINLREGTAEVFLRYFLHKNNSLVSDEYIPEEWDYHYGSHLAKRRNIEHANYSIHRALHDICHPDRFMHTKDWTYNLFCSSDYASILENTSEIINYKVIDEIVQSCSFDLVFIRAKTFPIYHIYHTKPFFSSKATEFSLERAFYRGSWPYFSDSISKTTQKELINNNFIDYEHLVCVYFDILSNTYICDRETGKSFHRIFAYRKLNSDGDLYSHFSVIELPLQDLLRDYLIISKDYKSHQILYKNITHHEDKIRREFSSVPPFIIDRKYSYNDSDLTLLVFLFLSKSENAFNNAHAYRLSTIHSHKYKVTINLLKWSVISCKKME